jgi:hypothetical protein
VIFVECGDKKWKEWERRVEIDRNVWM